MSDQDKNKRVAKPVIERRLWENILEQKYAEKRQHDQFDRNALREELTDCLFDNIRWRRNLQTLPPDLEKELREALEDFFIQKNL